MKRYNWALMAALLITGISCSDDDASSANGDYFPLHPNQQWSYSRLIGSEPEFQDFGTVTLQTGGPVIADGKIYRRITGWDGYIDFEVRRDGSKYFERNALFSDDKEYKFLDTDKTVGESWSYVIDEHIQKVKYTVLSKNAVQEIKETVYHNVITIGVDYYQVGESGESEVWLSSKHVYAEGIGEVYSFEPYPLSMVYGDVKSTRIR